MKLSRPVSFLIYVAGGIAFAVGHFYRPAPTHIKDEFQVIIPVPIQVLSGFGDRFLAANIGTWRAVMVGTHKLGRSELAALAQVQESASWLNPGHEDNYYTATAILPWEGEVSSTQIILERASQARPNDMYAPFFHGFNAMHFLGDYVTAVNSLKLAAHHASSESDKQALAVIATNWSERNEDPAMAQRMVMQMAKETRDPALRKHLEQRAERLAGLAMLRKAAKEFQKAHTEQLTNLEQLVGAGLLDRIPADPLGTGYTIKNNWPVLQSAKE